MKSSALTDLCAQLKSDAPLVQNITNTVVQQFSANVLLALGASPAMLDHAADAAEFARLADALLVNYGTATDQQFLAADMAIDAVNTAAKPWVLDPVSVGAVSMRSTKIRQALMQRPTVVRGNASEILALADMGKGGRGVDAIDTVDAAVPAAIQLARQTQAVIAVSGATDIIVGNWDDAMHVAHVHGGHALMPYVIGTGCALGSSIAAYLGSGRKAEQRTTSDVFTATVAAHAHFAHAGAQAARVAQAPGSFAVAFLDALYAFEPQDMAAVSIDYTSADPDAGAA